MEPNNSNVPFKKASGEGPIRTGYFVAFALLVIACVITLYMNKRLAHHASEVEHTYQVINQLETMISRFKDGENGVRGYVISKNKDFLTPYFGSYEEADSLYKLVRDLVADNPYQEQRLLVLKPYMNKRAEISRFNILEFDRNNQQITDTMRNLLPVTRELMNHIRSGISVMKEEEISLLSERDKKFKSSITALRTLTTLSLGIAVLLLIFGLITFALKNRELRAAGGEIDIYQAELKKRIDELNKANNELVRMRNQEKFAATGRIARTIAHEVRNPLTNINLAADQLRSELGGKEESTAYLFEMIGRNSNRINQLISDLLNSTKFSDLNSEKTSVNELLDNALQEAEDRIALTNIRVIKRYSKEACTVKVDREKMKVAFLNIIINALEAMEAKKDGRLVIETKAEKDKCRVTILDNGEGMDSESQLRLFEPYFTTRLKGNGLGLTNTQNIILNHKGEILVESQKDLGTSFTILIDLA